MPATAAHRTAANVREPAPRKRDPMQTRDRVLRAGIA
jgi:hypothetical protein